jgi:hypothetical protein
MSAYVSPECAGQRCASCTDLACSHSHHDTLGWPGRDFLGLASPARIDPADDGQGDYLYTIVCCGNDIDIWQGLEAHCPGCRSTFVATLERNPAESGVIRDTAGAILRGPSLPCGCPLDADCNGRHS